MPLNSTYLKTKKWKNMKIKTDMVKISVRVQEVSGVSPEEEKSQDGKDLRKKEGFNPGVKE